MQQFNNLIDISSLKCFHHHQNNSALYVSLNNKLSFEERLLCEDCLIVQQSTNETISLNKLVALLQEQKNNQQSQIDFLIQKVIQKISKFCCHINSFKIQILQVLDKINMNCNQWLEELQTLNQRNFNFDFLFELQQFELIDNDFKTKSLIHFKQQFADLNCYHYQNVENFIKELEINIREDHFLIEFQHLLKYVHLLNKDKEQQIKQNTQIKLNLAAEIKQDNWCGVIVFNKQGSIMVSGYDSNIKVWKLKDSLPIEKGYILNGHKNQVYSIVFSKKFNWFISGCSGDDKLISWKEVRNTDQWESFSTLDTVSSVWCLILNENENQLLSSHDDGSIRVWIVNYFDNLIIFEYSLQMHNSFVYQISLNESQNQLVSCSEDKQIIIWKLSKNLIWQFGYVITNSIDDYGQRIAFINDDTIIWCQNQGNIHIFQLLDSNFVENVNLQLIPIKVPNSDQYNLFPLIFNKSNEILILKHLQYVYILRQQVNKQFKMLSEPIVFESSCMFGNLNDDGSLLVVWNMVTRSFRFYSLEYF